MAAATPPSKVRPRRWRRWLIWLLGLLVGGPPLLLALYAWAALRFAYSEGERAGYVQKFSKKGWVCKTWEGELAMMPVPGSVPEIFRFTVRSDGVAGEVNRNMGERVTLHYEQHPPLPSTCFGETPYFVVGVRRVAQ